MLFSATVPTWVQVLEDRDRLNTGQKAREWVLPGRRDMNKGCDYYNVPLPHVLWQRLTAKYLDNPISVALVDRATNQTPKDIEHLAIRLS